MFKFTNILPPVINEEPLLQQIGSETTLVLSKDANATSTNLCQTELSTIKPIEEHDIYESPLLDSTWVFVNDVSASKESITTLAIGIEEHHAPNLKIIF